MNFGEILIKIQNFSFTKNASENIVCEIVAILPRRRLVEALLASDTIWCGKSLSSLTQVMAYCHGITWSNVYHLPLCHKAWPGGKWMKHRSFTLNTLRLRQNCHYFTDNIFKCIFLNENIWFLLKISLNFVPKVRNNNVTALVQIMVWCRPGDKPLSEAMTVSLLTHIYITRPQWVNSIGGNFFSSLPGMLFSQASYTLIG